MTRARRTGTVVLIALLAGCGSATAPGDGTPAETMRTTAEIEQGPETGDHSVGPPNPSQHEYRFGQTHEDRISVTVDNFVPLDPEDTADLGEPGEPPAEWSVDLTYTNNTNEAVHPAMFGLYPRVDGTEEDLALVFEHDGVDEGGAIPPGTTVVVPVAFTGAGSTYRVNVVQPDQSSMAVFTGGTR